jgi:hypothetical protein
VRLGGFGLGDLYGDVADASKLLDRVLGIVEGLAVPAGLVLHLGDALSFDRFGDYDRRLSSGARRFLVGAVDGGEVVAIDLDRVPAEGPGPAGVGVEIPAVHGLAPLAEAVDVDDGRKVVEPAERRMLEGLPHRALGDLAVSAEAPYAVRKPVELLPGEGDADRDRQALAERAGRDVHPRQYRSGVAFEAASHLPESEELFLADRSRRFVDRVEQR